MEHFKKCNATFWGAIKYTCIILASFFILVLCFAISWDLHWQRELKKRVYDLEKEKDIALTLIDSLNERLKLVETNKQVNENFILFL